MRPTRDVRLRWTEQPFGLPRYHTPPCLSPTGYSTTYTTSRHSSLSRFCSSRPFLVRSDSVRTSYPSNSLGRYERDSAPPVPRLPSFPFRGDRFTYIHVPSLCPSPAPSTVQAPPLGRLDLACVLCAASFEAQRHLAMPRGQNRRVSAFSQSPGRITRTRASILDHRCIGSG